MFDDLSKNQRYNERSPVPGLEPETPSWMERTLTTMPQLHASGRGVVLFIMVVDNNYSGTFRPVEVMIVRKTEINVPGSFRISCQY